MRALIYALGGGAGHLTRAYALARPALAAGHEVEILAGGTFNGWLVERLRGTPGLTVVHLDPGRGRQVCVAAVRARLQAGGFDRLVVDTFPRGLVGELATVRTRVPRVLVARALVPAYGDRPEVRQARQEYDLVLEPEGWLVRDAHELLPADEARRRLGARGGGPLAAVLGSGTPAECEELATLARRAELPFLGPPTPYWPALELHAGIDLLVASAGWNTVAEARACGTPLAARPRPRTYDDQGARVGLDERWSDPRQLADRLTALARRPPATIDYVNGAIAAAAALFQ